MEEKRRGSKDRKRDRPSSSPLSPPTPKIQRKQEVGAEQQGSPSHPCVNYVECPQKFEDDGKKISIFMAGGISGCSDWQTDLKEKLHSRISRLVLINPRRHNFNSKDESLTRGQITWEFQHLRLASAILFWFPKETLCPITLYELGCWNMEGEKKLFIGCHPEYQRRIDVIIQTELVRGDGLKVVSSIDELADQIEQWYRSEEASKEQ